MFDCQTRHSSVFFYAKGRPTSRDHSPKGIGTTKNLLEMCESVVWNTRGEQVMMFISENHGCVTVCHGDDFRHISTQRSCHELDRSLFGSSHFGSRVLAQELKLLCLFLLHLQ